MHKTIYGISAKKQHGKDTFFDIVHQHCPRAVRLAFADPLKMEVGLLMAGIFVAIGYGLVFLSSSKILDGFGVLYVIIGTLYLTSPVAFINQQKTLLRKVLQWWGTEFRRNLCGKNYWLDRMADQINDTPEDAIIFVTDTRFANEADFVRQHGGLIIRLKRDNCPHSAGDNHASETELESIKPDFQINAATVDELERKTIQWLQQQGFKSNS